MKYEALKEYSDDEINKIITFGNDEEIKLVLMSIGEYHTNLDEAQKICIFLLDSSKNEDVCACAILSLSYLARRFKMLDKKIIPYLKREKRRNKKCKEGVKYSIEDIKLFVNWY